MGYQVKLDVFEGPFDLLLGLISKHELDVYEISVSQITREYLSYIKRMQELDLEVASEFLLVAAALLQIKSAGLLSLDQEEEEEEEEELSYPEMKAMLIGRLVEYKQFKKASLALSQRLSNEYSYFTREVQIEDRFLNLIPDFLDGVEPENLTKLFLQIRVQEEALLHESLHIIAPPINIEEKIEFLLERLSSSKQSSFRELTKKCSNRLDVISAFLALLELYKQEIVDLNQAETFGDIEVELLEERV